jgi:predicted membrane-bound spermidine synthase
MSIASDSKLREPHWYGLLARVLLVTFVGTLLVFAVSLLLGMVGTVIASGLHGTRADMTVAYRYIALPTAAIAGLIVLVLALAMEIQHYRQAKALASISRAS